MNSEAIIKNKSFALITLQFLTPLPNAVLCPTVMALNPGLYQLQQRSPKCHSEILLADAAIQVWQKRSFLLLAYAC